MEQINHLHHYEDFHGFELKHLSPPELQERLMADLQPHTDYESRAKISAAFSLADFVHEDRKRINGSPYISHPLRNANRIVTYFEVRDPEIIMATLLHDTVEDHPFEMAELAGFEPETEQEARDAALWFVGDLFGERVERIVNGVTTPIYDGPEDGKNEFYRRHVEEAIEDPDVLVVKLSDFFDNAVGLQHTESAKLIKKVVPKYDGVFPVFESRLGRDDVPMSDEVKQYAIEQLAKGRETNRSLGTKIRHRSHVRSSV